MANLKRFFTTTCLHSSNCLLLLIAGGIVTFAVIDFAHAIGQPANGSVSSLTVVASEVPKEKGSGRADIPAPAVASTPPQCILCMTPVELTVNFDDVTPPALPLGCTATNVQGPPPLWVTSDSGVPTPPADTLPNSAFIDDPDVVSDKLLDLGTFTVFESLSPQLTFKQNFNLEASDEDPNLGFDGGVLEISVDQGQTYQDILDAGGTFVTGGYNRMISTDRGSPIAGRLAWSGNSGGFITTTVRLPNNIIQGTLRWRMASDTSGSSEGWRVDTVDITWCQGPPCTPTPPPPITPTPTPSATPRVTPRPRPAPHPRPSQP